MEKRSRRFAFTQMNLDFVYDVLGNVDYLIVGLEEAPTTGKKHHQGYVEYPSQRTVKSVCKKLAGAHVEVAIANSEKNREYCSKGQVILEIGTPTDQGKRKDLEAMVEEIKENPNLTINELIEMNPGAFCRNYKALEIVRSAYEPKRNWVTEVIYIWGDSGCGKTRRAIEAGATNVQFAGGFFSGYAGEDIVLLDDVDRWTFFKNRQTLLELLDRYPYNINVKGGHRNWKPRTIYITSNYAPCVTFGEDGIIDPAIKRRLSSVENLTHKF